MATQFKMDTVEEYAQKFKDAKSIFIADFKGMDVEQTNDLRRAFRAADVEYRVLKNTLAKLSLHKNGIEDLDNVLVGPSAFAFSETDPVAPVKVIKDFVKKNKNIHLEIKGCLFEGKIFDAAQADSLAELPTREVLISQFVGLLQAPMSKLVGVLNASGQKLVGALTSLKDNKTE